MLKKKIKKNLAINLKPEMGYLLNPLHLGFMWLSQEHKEVQL